MLEMDKFSKEINELTQNFYDKQKEFQDNNRALLEKISAKRLEIVKKYVEIMGKTKTLENACLLNMLSTD